MAFWPFVQISSVAIQIGAGQVEVLRVLASALIIAARVLAFQIERCRGAVLWQNGMTNPETDSPRVVLFGLVAATLILETLLRQALDPDG